jgi:hypothetical protein
MSAEVTDERDREREGVEPADDDDVFESISCQIPGERLPNNFLADSDKMKGRHTRISHAAYVCCDIPHDRNKDSRRRGRTPAKGRVDLRDNHED